MHPLPDDITQLAPDEKSLVAARQSMAVRLWSESGLSETAVWGQCAGSTTYNVAVDLLRFGYRCNCPSRKRPCRHVLALLLRLATQAESLPEGTPPADVQSWLDQRRKREQQAASAAPAPQKAAVDEAGKAKRTARRSERVEQGIVQLQCWLKDLIRNGLAGIELQGRSFWEGQARRLVDAQAPGLAARIRALGELPSQGRDWPARLLFELGRLELLLHAARRLADLPEDLQSEVRQLCGWTVGQSELDAHPDRAQETWVVIAQQEEDQDRLRVQRNWLLGLTTGRPALILQFAPGNSSFAEFWKLGTVFTGTLQFYPGVTRLRARVLERTDSDSVLAELPGLDSIEQLFDEFARQLSEFPWLASSVHVLKNATLTVAREQWFVRDTAGQGLPLAGEPPWRLLAEKGDAPVDLIVEWNGESLRILSWMHSGKLFAR